MENTNTIKNETVNNSLVKVEVQVRVCETKGTDGKEPHRFNSFKAVTKDGKLIDCKFRKEVLPPSTNSIIEVYRKNMNMAKNTKYPCVWISKIEKITKLAELKREISNDDLPF